MQQTWPRRGHRGRIVQGWGRSAAAGGVASDRAEREGAGVRRLSLGGVAAAGCLVPRTAREGGASVLRPSS